MGQELHGHKLQMTPGAVDYSRWVTPSPVIPMIPPSSHQFRQLYKEVISRLQSFMTTEKSILVLSSPGTVAIEAVITNAFAPGDKVITLCNGYFGNRIDTIARRFGLDSSRIDFDWRTPYSTEKLARFLDSHEGQLTKAVFAVHLETSTGIINDISAISDLLKDRNLFFIVDGVSSLGVHPCELDNWAVDAFISVSYKGLLSSPVLSFIALSPGLLSAMQRLDRRVYSFDLVKIYEYGNDRSTMLWTPSVPALITLNDSLIRFEQTSMDEHRKSCKAIAESLRKMLVGNGLHVYNQSSPSDCVTVVNLPKQVIGDEIISSLESRYGIFVGDGLGQLKGKVLRFGHYGNVTETDLTYLQLALEGLLVSSNQ